MQFVGATKNGAGGFNKAIDEGDTITVSVTMDQIVTVDTAGGTPTLAINIGGVIRQATYASGSGTDTLTFTYDVVDGDFDHDGVELNADGIALAGAIIQDVYGNNANLSHAAVAANTDYRVDTIDLGGTDGLLIRGAQADGNWYFAWDGNGNGIHNDFGNWGSMSALNGQNYNGVTTTLPEFGMAALSEGFKPGTAVSGGGDNPTYDGMLAIWDAYNGSGTATGVAGVPTGWSGNYYWSATPSPSGHARVYLFNGYVVDASDSYNGNAAYQVL